MSVGYRSPTSATQGTGTSIAGPAFTAATNEVLLLVVTMRSTTATCSTPAGWTLQYSTTGTISRRYVFTRTTTDAGSTFTLSASVNWSVEYTVLTNATGILSSAIATSSSSASSITQNSPAYGSRARLFYLPMFEAAAGLTPSTTLSANLVAQSTSLAGVQQGLYMSTYEINSDIAASGGTFSPGGAYDTGGNYGEVRVLAIGSAAVPPLAPSDVYFQDLTVGSGGQFVADHDSGDLANTSFTALWTFNRDTAQQGTDTEQSYAFRRKVVGAGAYEWWNASTQAWQASEVFNTTNGANSIYPSKRYVTFPTGKWTANTYYQYSVATVGTLTGTAGPYAADQSVYVSIAPTVVVTGPAGVGLQTTRPVFTWSYSDADGNPQKSAIVDLYLTSDTLALGFVPGQFTNRLTQLSVSGTGTSATCNIDLSTGTSYTAYVRCVEDAGAGYNGNNKRSAAFTFTLSPLLPGTPTLSMGAPSNGQVVATITPHDNHLSENQASFESAGVEGWYPNTSVQCLRQSTQVLYGTYAMSLQRLSTTGDASAGSGNGTVDWLAVLPNTQYTAMASFRAAATSRSVRVEVSWYTAAKAFISTSTGTSVADSTSAWTQATVTATSPSNAAFCIVTIRAIAAVANEIHYVDGMGIFLGSSTTWTRGGLVGLAAGVLERSDDGGTTWTTVTDDIALPSPQAAVTYTDTSFPINTSLRYRARVTADA